jgi:hypothetical protein
MNMQLLPTSINCGLFLLAEGVLHLVVASSGSDRENTYVYICGPETGAVYVCEQVWVSRVNIHFQRITSSPLPLGELPEHRERINHEQYSFPLRDLTRAALLVQVYLPGMQA